MPFDLGATIVQPRATFPLSPIEVQARNHALLSSIGFLVLLPLGSLIARYVRTFTRRWFWAHACIQFVVSAPVIFAGWSLGYRTSRNLDLPQFFDPHQKMGLVLLVMYLAQLFIGVFIHYIKIPLLGEGRRPLQNYFHAILGLTIFVVAASQVHYGLYTEWLLLGGAHPITDSAKHAWLALVIVFWVLYGAGLALLPRQIRQERNLHMTGKEDRIALNDNVTNGSNA